MDAAAAVGRASRKAMERAAGPAVAALILSGDVTIKNDKDPPPNRRHMVRISERSRPLTGREAMPCGKDGPERTSSR